MFCEGGRALRYGAHSLQAGFFLLFEDSTRLYTIQHGIDMFDS